jgi:Protein phosphatase inhibitor
MSGHTRAPRRCLPCTQQEPRLVRSASATMTMTEEEAALEEEGKLASEQESKGSKTYILRLKAAPPQKKTVVQWSEDTVDNEHLGKKSSKRTCFALHECFLLFNLPGPILFALLFYCWVDVSVEHNEPFEFDLSYLTPYLLIHMPYTILEILLNLGCCIFHKKKQFAESDSDESDSDVEAAERSLPRPGQPKNYQRHHA